MDTQSFVAPVEVSALRNTAVEQIQLDALEEQSKLRQKLMEAQSRIRNLSTGE